MHSHCRADARTKLLPVRLLTSDRFDSAAMLNHLQCESSSERGTNLKQRFFTAPDFLKRLVQFVPDDDTKSAANFRLTSSVRYRSVFRSPQKRLCQHILYRHQVQLHHRWDPAR